MFRSLELFAGAGGLALGTSRAGFQHKGVIEWDHDACSSMFENKNRGLEHIREWPVIEADVRNVRYSEFGENLELLAGGVPCQPWSLGGKHKGQEDQRNLFPEMVRAVRDVRPKAVLIENVRGLLRQSFSNYFEYILLYLRYPEIAVRQDEPWEHHLKRLEQHHTSQPIPGLQYNVAFRLLNAADFGVPQKRERVFIVAFRNDIAANWSFPDPTHSIKALNASKWVNGGYWDRHCISIRKRPKPTTKELRSTEKGDLFNSNLQPWLTVRDALKGLAAPSKRESKDFFNHVLIDGARVYPGHTGSPLDEPSKTLKAGDHGVPGGENTVVLDDGSVRYLSIREAARIQTFPDGYVFPVSWTESMRQLGNAVPVTLAEIVARSVREHLSKQHAKTGNTSHTGLRKAV